MKNLAGNYNNQFNYTDHYQKDADLFEYFTESDNAMIVHEARRLHEFIFQKIKKSCSIILDVGCGNGWVAQKAIEKGIMVISMDVSFTNTEKVLKLYNGVNHFGLVADVFNLPVKNNSIDCIIASEIMEHVNDPRKFVEILYEKIKENGKLIISTPYNEKIEYYLCIHCNKPTPKHAHLHSFNETNIAKLIPGNSEWSWSKFSNKYLSKLRTHVLLKYLPFRQWKVIDNIANKIFNRPMRLLIEIKKLPFEH